jgi:hypothetical protein
MMEKTANIVPQHQEAPPLTKEAAPKKNALQRAREGIASLGEKLFDFITYVVLNHGVNFVISAFAGVEARRRGAKEKFFGYTGKWGFSEGVSDRFLDVVALSVGGHFTAACVKKMEDHKQEVVDSLNTTFGTEHQSVPLVDNRTQTWGTILQARLSAMGIVTLMMEGVGRLVNLPKFEEKFADGFYKFFKQDLTKAKGTYWHDLTKVVSLEFLCVTLSAILFKFIAKFLAKEKPEELAVPKLNPTAPAANDDNYHQDINATGRVRDDGKPTGKVAAKMAEHAVMADVDRAAVRA